MDLREIPKIRQKVPISAESMGELASRMQAMGIDDSNLQDFLKTGSVEDLSMVFRGQKVQPYSGPGTGVVWPIFKVTIDYSQTIEQMIEAAEVGCTIGSEDIDITSLPLCSEERQLAIARVSDNIVYKRDVEVALGDQCKQFGFVELLQFAPYCAELSAQGIERVFALGTIVVNGSSRLNPILYTPDKQIYLDLLGHPVIPSDGFGVLLK